MLLGSRGLVKKLASIAAVCAGVSSFLFATEVFAATSTTKTPKASRNTKTSEQPAPEASTSAPSVASATTTRANDETPASVSFAQDDSRVGYARGESVASPTNRSYWRFAKDSKFAYKLGSNFDSFANEREQAQYFGINLGADYMASLSESLSFRGRANAAVSSGYAQSRFGDNVGRSGFYLYEATLSWRAIDTAPVRFYLTGGALDQSAFDAPLFLDRQAFPGAKETFVFGHSKVFEVRLWAQQTIPTSKTLSTKTVDAEVTPSLYTETLQLKLQPFTNIKTEASITHFIFNNLPSGIAQESVIYGNSVDEIGPNTSRFKYRFEGLLARGEFQIDFTQGFAWNVQGYAIQNPGAPEGYRNGQYVQTGLKIGLPGEIDLQPVIGTFFVEDDAVPGFYNASSTGHNNRKGMNAVLGAFFQRQRFSVRAEYVDADVINYNINQSRQQTLMLRFETFYEML